MDWLPSGGSMRLPRFVRPGILTHPWIPASLHGVAPRVIEGQGWWDRQRKAAYAMNDWCCWACGMDAAFAEPRPGLEAHEVYAYDFGRREATLREVVALCPACHQFIHMGRLWALFQEGKLPLEGVARVLLRGLGILERAGLQPWWQTEMVYRVVVLGEASTLVVDELEAMGRIPERQPGSWRLLHGGRRWVRGPGGKPIEEAGKAPGSDPE